MSRPLVTVDRAVGPRTQFKNRPRRRLEKMHRGRFVLKTDVAQFYPSVYTHSLGWALDGKAAVKQRLKQGKNTNTLADRLDRAIQAGQDGQTKGVPIGPDTSFLAAEIVLSAIDDAMQRRIPGFSRSALRFFDDLEYYTATRVAAEDALLAWETELARFELTLNGDKTTIEEAPAVFQPPWLLALKSIPLRPTSDAAAIAYIVNYFDRAFEHASRNPKDAVVSYAIQRFRRWTFNSETWRWFYRLLLASVVAEPSALPHVAYAMARARAANLKSDQTRLQETLNDLAGRHARLSQGAEVIWSLWLLMTNKLPLDDEVAKAVADMRDNTCGLGLFHMRDRKLIGSGVNLARVEAQAGDVFAIANGDWLLAYESTHHGWASGAAVAGDKLLSGLLQSGVCFFNPRLRIRIPKTLPTIGVRPKKSKGQPKKRPPRKSVSAPSY